MQRASADCENLIRRMLQVEPSRRLPLRDVKRHKWMRAGLEQPNVTAAVSGQARRGAGEATASLGAPHAALVAAHHSALPPPLLGAGQQPPKQHSRAQRPRASEASAAAASLATSESASRQQCDEEDEEDDEELSEQALRLMTAAGISRDKTIDAIQRHAFDHYV